MENEIWTISEFPDELLLKILSSLPSHECLVKAVAISLEGCDLFEDIQLKMSPDCSNTDIKPLVNMAIARSMKELRIEMVYKSFEFPKTFYIFSQLETVILEKLSLVDVPPDVHMPCLKRLHLLTVKFSGDESVKTLLSICPILEVLVVKRSSLTNVMIYTIDVPTLSTLSIDNTSGKSRPKGVHGFVINAPSLRYLSIRDRFSNYLQFENMPELVKASVSIVCDNPDKFLGSLASTQYLSLCSVASETPYPPTGTSFVFLDHLELCSCSAEWWNLLTCLLDDAPKLRVLKLKLYRKHCIQYKEVMDPWNQPDYVPRCLSSHLEIFEWRQYNGTEREREVATYILENASCLKKVTFYSDSAEKHGILKELECVARGSNTCHLVFH